MSSTNSDYCPVSDTNTFNMFSASEIRRRGSLLTPLPRQSKTDLNQMVAALTAEVANHQGPTIEFQQILDRQQEINKHAHCWKRGRRRKARLRKSAKHNVPKALPCAGFKIGSLSTAAGIIQNVQKFRELMRLKKTLSEELFDSLREQFHIVDADDSGYITIEEVKRVNSLLCPRVSLTECHEDAAVLFKKANVDGFMSELQWLQAWARHVKANNYCLEFVEDFVEDFEEMEEHANISQILASDYAPKLSICVIKGLMKWKNDALLRREAKLEEEEKLAEFKRQAEMLTQKPTKVFSSAWY